MPLQLEPLVQLPLLQVVPLVQPPDWQTDLEEHPLVLQEDFVPLLEQADEAEAGETEVVPDLHEDAGETAEELPDDLHEDLPAALSAA